MTALKWNIFKLDDVYIHDEDRPIRTGNDYKCFLLCKCFLLHCYCSSFLCCSARILITLNYKLDTGGLKSNIFKLGCSLSVLAETKKHNRSTWGKKTLKRVYFFLAIVGDESSFWPLQGLTVKENLMDIFILYRSLFALFLFCLFTWITCGYNKLMSASKPNNQFKLNSAACYFIRPLNNSIKVI